MGEAGEEAMNAAMVGGVVVGASLAAAVILCTSLCLALWCRRLRGGSGEPSPATFLVTKRKAGQEFIPDHPMALVLPTITQSEADSEPLTPTSSTTMPPTSEGVARRGGPPFTPYTQALPRPGDLDTAPYPRLAALASPPSYFPLPTYAAQHPRPSQRPRSASPRTLLPASPRTPPLSLPLGARRWPSGTRPASPLTPGTPPGLPSRFFRKGVPGVEDLRAALHHSFVGGEVGVGEAMEVSTPDSIEGWAPVWTPASSVGSGGGCGLGEVQLRLRYMVRTRLLHLLLYSADQLPLRLGPDPVATYTKAVLLPEKRVRFTTPWVAATDTAIFNASFTHPTRPSRLAHATLRLSVCQALEVTGCGRRVVVGYCAVNLAAVGMRSGLTQDLDTGLLALHLQETAPDQQVGVGGQLRMGLKWDTEVGVLTIRIACVSGLQLLHLQPPLQDNAQAYVKVTVYVNNTILCWRRSGPRGVAAVIQVEEDLALTMPELDLDATHLVLSVRLRTRPGAGRRVVGSCLVGRGGCVGEDGRHHWEDMLRASPDFVTRSHPLTSHHDPAAYPAHDHDSWRLDGAGTTSRPTDHYLPDTGSSDYPTAFTTSAISSRPLILPTPVRALTSPPSQHDSPLSPTTSLTSPSTTTTTPSALTSPTSALSSPLEFTAPTVTFSSCAGFSSSSSAPSTPSAFSSPSAALIEHSVSSRGCPTPIPTLPNTLTPPSTLTTCATPTTPPLSPIPLSPTPASTLSSSTPPTTMTTCTTPTTPPLSPTPLTTLTTCPTPTSPPLSPIPPPDTHSSPIPTTPPNTLTNSATPTTPPLSPISPTAYTLSSPIPPTPPTICPSPTSPTLTPPPTLSSSPSPTDPNTPTTTTADDTPTLRHPPPPPPSPSHPRPYPNTGCSSAPPRDPLTQRASM